MIGVRRQQPGQEDSRAVERVREALEGYLADYGAGVSVPAADVLDLLSPQGMWRFGPGRQQAPERPPLPAGADPLTGCLPVTAPGRAGG